MRVNKEGPRPDRAHGVNKPTHRDKKDQERGSIGYGMRAHQERFNKERIATLSANRQGEFIEKDKAKELKAKEELNRPKKPDSV